MRYRGALLAVVFALAATPAGRAVTAITTQTLTISVGGLAKLSVPGSLAMSPTGPSFSPFAGSMIVNYRARTSPSGGGTITVKATADFSPSGGPSVASGDLTYTCSPATLGSSCSTSQTVSTSSGQTVVAVPAGACTGSGPCNSADPNTVALQFQLDNRPTASTGTYQVTLQFTASAI